MKKYFSVLLGAVAYLASVAASFAWTSATPHFDSYLHYTLLRGTPILAATAKSQFNPNFFLNYVNEFPTVNRFKIADQWVYSNYSGTPQPNELTANGYAIPGAAWTATGIRTLYPVPIQAEDPGNSVLLWLGHASFAANPNGAGSSVVSCTGTGSTPFGSAQCDNTQCSDFTASFAPGVGNYGLMTVTAAPTGSGCTIGLGAPVSGQISQFDTMTVVVGNSTTNSNRCSPACTGSGGTGTYAVNISQTAASGTVTLGGRLEFSWSTNVVGYSGNALLLQMAVNQNGTSLGTMTQVTNIAAFNVNDEAAYQTSHIPCGNGKACIVSPIFKQRAQQANFATMRDLNWGGFGGYNRSNCTTWSARKSVNMYSWAATEFRNAAAGTETYTVQGQVYTIPKIGQYVNSGGTGASGGTVSYNAGTDVYSITLGSGNFVDKQMTLVRFPAAGTGSSKVSLNGNTAVPLLHPTGGAISGFGQSPKNGEVATLVYDATLAGALFFSQQNSGQIYGLDCGVPPEVTMEIVAELQETLEHVVPYMAMDPATDWVTQHATYQKANYSYKPTYDVSNEPFNCPQWNAQYMSAKSRVYIAQDTNGAWVTGGLSGYCGSGGNNVSWTGKTAYTIGQDLVSVYGAGNYELAVPVITTFPLTSIWYDALVSNAYIGQSMAAQSGYSKGHAYTVATRVSNSNYWNPGIYCGSGNGTGQGPCDPPTTNSYRGLEAGLAYCYYYFTTSSACQGAYANQAAIMTAYMNSSIGTSCGSGTCNGNNITGILGYVNAWSAEAKTCFTGGARPGGCTIDPNNPILMYEGTYSLLNMGSDMWNTFTSATNAATAVLSIPNNGCVAGQTVALSSLTGGTWASAAGSYTVQASGTDSSHCAINLNSTGLGTLTGATLTYTGSMAYINVLRQASYLSPDLATLVNTLYSGIISNGGAKPSMFNLNDYGPFADSPWLAFGPSLYSGLQMGICTSCSISSTTLTLGGTITGIFRTGDTLYGTGITGPGKGSSNQTKLGACTPVGSNVCGTTAGDTFALNQSSTGVSAAALTTVAPTYTSSSGGYQCSPVTQWKAIMNYNGVTACN